MTKTNDYKSRTLVPRRMVLALVAAVVVALGMVAATSGEAHAAGGKIVTKAFAGTSKIEIPELGQANLYPSELNASGFKRGRIRDVNLYLHGISHTYPDDLDMMLVGPTGRRAVVMSDAGGSFDVSGATLALNDDNVGSPLDPLPDDSAFVSNDLGYWKPANYGATADSFPSPAPASSGDSALSVFDGSRPNGTWKLYVVDDGFSDGGKVDHGWTLEIKVRVSR